MDPNATLESLLTLSATILGREYNDYPNDKETVEMAEEMAGLVEALDNWLCKGGFIPSRWVKDGVK